jgi:putative endonuclease
MRLLKMPFIRREECHSCACYAYILRCADGTLYTGWTNDLPRRVQAHNYGVGCNYTICQCGTLVYREVNCFQQDRQIS